MSKNPFSFFWADWLGRLPYRRYREREDRARRLYALVFSFLTLALGAAYLLWMGWLVSRNPGWQDLSFLAAETLAFLLLAFLAYDIWHLRYHQPQGLAPAADYPVDIFVPCCGEPLEVIRTTLPGREPGLSIPCSRSMSWMTGVAPVADLARSLGFHYLSRPQAGLPLENAKSGNLNFGLSLSQGEMILVLDADQVPAPDILTPHGGFFPSAPGGLCPDPAGLSSA